MNTDPPKVHRDLCGLRFDNRFGFASNNYHGITTTCFNDVVLEPLATWTLLFVLLPLLAVVLKRKQRLGSSRGSTKLIHYRAEGHSGRHGRWRSALDVLYMLLVLAALLMSKLLLLVWAIPLELISGYTIITLYRDWQIKVLISY